MNKTLFGFIFEHSKKQQIILIAAITASYPFYYLSLDLPKTIVNEAIGGDIADFPKNMLGYDLEQINYLLVLCFTFLSLVLINGGFKYFINVFRGVLAERMLRRLRYQLLTRVLRFPLPHFKNISHGEVVSMISAETEPVGPRAGEKPQQPGKLVDGNHCGYVGDRHPQAAADLRCEGIGEPSGRIQYQPTDTRNDQRGGEGRLAASGRRGGCW